MARIGSVLHSSTDISDVHTLEGGKQLSMVTVQAVLKVHMEILIMRCTGLLLS